MPRVAVAAAVLAAVFLTIYLPAAGHGFISDDFRWIVESRVEDPGDLARLFSRNVGFYRPLVAATFAADYALWTTNAFGYALTNLGLLFVSAALLWTLARRFGLPPVASLFAVAVWLFNFHAVNMALLWLSGRTALVVSVCALATACLFLSGRIVLASVTCLAAMLSKEEAVALPALFSTFALVTDRSPVSAIRRTWLLWAALPIYLALRLQSGAFWPTDAPSFYAFTLSPPLIARNILEYADRAGTVGMAIVLLLVLLARVRPRHVDEPERRALVFAGLWIAATYALTVFLPVRSSLYALLPSIGIALAAGVTTSAALRVDPRRVHAIGIGLIVLTMALVPVYRLRNARWVELAELSERVMTTLERATSGRPVGHVVLVDDLGERFNLDAAFGSLFAEAVTLRLGNDWSGEVVARLEEATRHDDLNLQLEDGNLRTLRTP